MVINSTSKMKIVRNLILRYGWNTMSYQILNPGISHWFSERRDAVIGYVETGTYIIAAGSPVSSEERLEDVVLEFFGFVKALKKKVCFFGAQQRIAPILHAVAPVSAILLGAQPIWSPSEWLASLREKSSLRAQVHRAVNKGISSELWNRATAVSIDTLTGCLKEWIDSRRLPPMRFLVEPNILNELDDRIVVIAKKYDQVVGFCVASPIPLRNGWLIEQIIRGQRAPNGTAELMLETMIRHLETIGANLVTLGLSPLSLHYPPLQSQPLWLTMLLRITRLGGKIFYNFDGLDVFKAKFLPVQWEPMYAITNEKKPTLSTLYAIGEVFAGMSPVRFLMKGAVRIVRR